MKIIYPIMPKFIGFINGVQHYEYKGKTLVFLVGQFYVKSDLGEL